uniref:Uncharacterized protein n=1 Tax=Ditylenchus dipsaci TaxID=166011 RepID=A0A915DP17_9BILA
MVEAIGSKLDQIVILDRIKEDAENRLVNIDIHKLFVSRDVNIVEFADINGAPQILEIIHSYTGSESGVAMIDGAAAAQFTQNDFENLKGCLKNWKNQTHTIAMLGKDENDLNLSNKIQFPTALLSSAHNKELLDIYAAKIWKNQENVSLSQMLHTTSPIVFC